MSKKSIKTKNPLLLELAKKIRLRRHELHLTQEELAEAAEIHVNFVGGTERATRNPSFTSLIKIAKALRMEPKDLMP